MVSTSANGNGNGRPSQWIYSAIGVLAVVLGSMITFFIQTATTSGQVATLVARVNSLEANYNILSERENSERTRIATMQAGLLEIETQFCGEDIVRNLMHANDLRLFALLWKKTFSDTAYPTDNAYYPQICNRVPQGAGVRNGVPAP